MYTLGLFLVCLTGSEIDQPVLAIENSGKGAIFIAGFLRQISIKNP
jgi:hypothetical protein